MAERTLKVFEVVLKKENPLLPRFSRRNPLLVRYAATLYRVKLARHPSSTKLSSGEMDQKIRV
jgi:hypothetical protein